MNNTTCNPLPDVAGNGVSLLSMKVSAEDLLSVQKGCHIVLCHSGHDLRDISSRIFL